MWKSAKETHRYEVDAILKLSDYTFYFSGEILVVENRLQTGSHLCRYFELCDDSSVNIWKLLFRQCGCLGPDTAEEEGNDLEPRNTFVISDDGSFIFSCILLHFEISARLDFLVLKKI